MIDPMTADPNTGRCIRILRIMKLRRDQTFEPVTLGHIRGHGYRDLLVCYALGLCDQSAVINTDRLLREVLLWPT